MLHHLVSGLTALGTLPAIGYLFLGALIGTFVGVVPGLSTAVILSIILVFAYYIDLTGTLCLFLGAQCGSFYSASISSILLNTPAHPEAFPITFDGYPMARKGQPGRALGLSAGSTFVGGILGCIVLVALLPVMNYFPQVFHPPEYVALVLLAMVVAGTTGSDSIGKVFVSSGIGLVLASIGPSAITGQLRYAFGVNGLFSGISLVAIALATFAIPQMIMVFGTGTATARQDMSGRSLDAAPPLEIKSGYWRELLRGVLDTFRYPGTLLQGGVIGGLIGIIPGIGGFTGNFVSYGLARQTSRRREQFGTGIPEGIIAPEGSSLAKEAGHMVPILGLGIPGGVAGALFIGALSIQSIRVGSGFLTTYPTLPYEIVWILALSGLIGTAAGVLAGGQLAKLARVPGPILVPFILSLSVAGVFLVDSQFFSVMEMAVFAVVGFTLRRLRYPLASFILGLVLGPTLEQNIYLTRNIYPGLTAFARRPLADIIVALIIGVIILKVVEVRRTAGRARAARASRAVPEAVLGVDGVRADVTYPLLSLITTVILLLIAAFVIAYGVASYLEASWLMPVIGGAMIGLPMLWYLPKDAHLYLRSRRPAERPAAVGRSEAGAVVASAPEAARDAVTAGRPATAVVDGGGTYSNGSATREAFVTAGAGDSDAPGCSPPPPAVSGWTGRLRRLWSADAPAGPDPVGQVASAERSWGSNGQYRREVAGFLWFFAAVALCWLIGFVWGSALFVLLYGCLATRRYFRTVPGRASFVVVSTVVIWGLVYEMFHLTAVTFTPLL